MAFPLPVKKTNQPSDSIPTPVVKPSRFGADTKTSTPAQKGPPSGFPPKHQPPGKKKKAKTNQFALPVKKALAASDDGMGGSFT